MPKSKLRSFYIKLIKIEVFDYAAPAGAPSRFLFDLNPTLVYDSAFENDYSDHILR